MKRITLVNSDGTQTITLPAELAYQDVHELQVIRVGDVMTLMPVRPSWDSFWNLPSADSDFLEDREQPVNCDRRTDL